MRISTGSAPTENVSGAPRKAGLRVAVDRVRLKTTFSETGFLV